MCSESEARDRQQHLELSPLECNPGSVRSGVISTISSSCDDHDHDGMSPSANNTMEQQTMALQKAARHRPTFNAQHVVKKYRRSAAGGGALSEASDKCPRTLDQLEKTVDYLLGIIFVNQMPPPAVVDDCCNDASNNTDDPNEISIWEEGTPVKSRPHEQQEQQHAPFSLSDTVSFIDDRLRAVQKDLVTLLGNLQEPTAVMSSSSNDNSISAKRLKLKHQRMKQTVRGMQAKMVRYNILASYLLSNVSSSKYEVKFGARALRTSLTCYLNLSTSLHDEYQNSMSQQQQRMYQTEHETQDEIMAYMALLHSSAVLRSEETALPPPSAGEITSLLMEDSGSGWGALLSTFCKHVLNENSNDTTEQGVGQRRGRMVEKYPRWKWALQLACAAQEGNYQCYFTLLEKGPALLLSSLAATSSDVTAADKEVVEKENARFLILARCCTSHSLNLVRLAQLRRYNIAFGKGEKVPAGDLSRLLRFSMDTTPDGHDETSMEAKKKAIDFCSDAGLPIVKKEGNEKELFVAMKSAPITIKGDEAIGRICNPGRMNDLFVFGQKFENGDGDVDSLARQLVQQCDIQEDVDDWEDRDGNNDDAMAYSKAERDGMVSTGTARNDEDGVFIPPSSVIKSLME